jgi:ferredoxin
VDAIKSDIEKGASDWVEHNTKYSELWPNITKKRPEDVPQDQEKWRGVKGKLKYFSEKPGKGS